MRAHISDGTQHYILQIKGRNHKKMFNLITLIHIISNNIRGQINVFIIDLFHFYL